MTKETKTPLELVQALRAPSFEQDSQWHTPKAVYATKPRALLDAAADAIEVSQARQRELEEALRAIEREAYADELIAAVRVKDENPTASARLMAQIARLRFAKRAQEIVRAALLNSPAGEQGEGWVLVPREPGSCEGDDSGWVLAFLRALHSHLPADEQPSAWMQFSDDQRERIKAGYRAMIATAPSPTGGER